MEVIIVANGRFNATDAILARLERSDLIIAADGGAVHLHRLGIPPEAVIGDMDSITPGARAFFKQHNIAFFSHPRKKDQTDTELCIDYAVKRGASDITLLGATGLRLDHTLANILLLKRLHEMNVAGRILDDHNEIHLVTRSLVLKGTPGDILSLVPISEQASGITLEGLEYPLRNATLNMGTAKGVSNRFIEKKVVISIASGMVLAIRSQD